MVIYNIIEICFQRHKEDVESQQDSKDTENEGNKNNYEIISDGEDSDTSMVKYL